MTKTASNEAPSAILILVQLVTLGNTPISRGTVEYDMFRAFLLFYSCFLKGNRHDYPFSSSLILIRNRAVSRNLRVLANPIVGTLNMT